MGRLNDFILHYFKAFLLNFTSSCHRREKYALFKNNFIVL